MELVKTFQFEAAHRSPYAEEPDRLHGHSYRADLVVSGPLDERLGWVMDYADMTEAFDETYRLIDHKTLNEIPGLDDVSTDGVQRWIENRLAGRLPGFARCRVSIVGACEFRPEQLPASPADTLPERIRFGFEAAHRLPELPSDHKCATMHGHSFVAEIGGGPAMQLADAARAIYNALDHRCLNDISGLENPTSEILAGWIGERMKGEGVTSGAVVVAETCTSRCIYRGEQSQHEK